MNLMIELDRSGVNAARAQNSEFGMAAVKTADVRNKSRRCVLIVAGQVGVTLGAGLIAGARQPQHAFVLDVAIGAGGSECLLGMMDRSVMTGQASLIGRAALEACLRDVTGRALFSKQRVRARHWTRVVWRWTAGQRMPAQPPESGHSKDRRKNAPPAWDAA